jgi:hypothetical protein
MVAQNNAASAMQGARKEQTKAKQFGQKREIPK